MPDDNEMTLPDPDTFTVDDWKSILDFAVQVKNSECFADETNEAVQNLKCVVEGLYQYLEAMGDTSDLTLH